MCTDKTLRDKIRKYNAAAAAEKAAKADKDKFAAEIMAEYTARGIDSFEGLKQITTSRETIKKADIPAAVWDRFKSVSSYSYLRQGKKA